MKADTLTSQVHKAEFLCRCYIRVHIHGHKDSLISVTYLECKSVILSPWAY